MEKKTIIETGDVQVLHHSLEGSPQFQSFHSIAPQRRHYCLGCSPSLVGQYQIFGKETCCIPLSIRACFTPCLPFWRWLGYMPSPTMHNWAIPPILCNVGSWLVWPPPSTICRYSINHHFRRPPSTMFRIVNLSKDFNWHQSTFNWFSFYSDTLKLRMRFWKRRAPKNSPENAKKWGPAFFLPRFFSRGILVMEILECVPTELFII